MPVNPTYPGVYIQELPSAVRTITGVPTSVAAFVGPATRGPAEKAVHITSFAEFERIFGGLDRDHRMGHAVYHFYTNGGSEAEIVRVVGMVADPTPPPEEPNAKVKSYPATISLKDKVRKPGDTQDPPSPKEVAKLKARGPGSWGLQLKVRVDLDTRETFDLPVPGPGVPPPPPPTLYNLTIRDEGTGQEERFLNISIDDRNPRSLKNVLAGSTLVEYDTPADPGLIPAAHPDVSGEEEPDVWKNPLGHAVATGGDYAPPATGDYLGNQEAKSGIHALRDADIFNILCAPDFQERTKLDDIARFCVEMRAMFIPDIPMASIGDAKDLSQRFPISRANRKNAALYFPEVKIADPTQDYAVVDTFNSGVMAGLWARTDVERGVWKAPAGTDASLGGVVAPSVQMNDLENGVLNPRAVNCLRQLPVYGNLSWGARTMAGADVANDQWKYLPVRRLALFIEESLFRGTKWVVFEPNDEPLWASIRLNVGAFMNNLFQQGAFQGTNPDEAYLVKCDRDNNPQNQIDLGIVNVLVGFAPLKPAEFVVISIQQLAGQIQV
ncbi:phage tail sheath subtilisin-like domain-containing protein [Allokutzneria multivorans]|uniref:Phage tail sheath subtilisin-like domain-containing protein n=1 Tax=Allokutzneria multivorans TaxID=1142134 RepID=A0ABP7S2U4_9PSEU